jgi:hypothetical protein
MNMDIDPIRLLDLAKVASDSFLKDGVPLNAAIAKLADKLELNPLQIQRVAEDANHRVQGALYKSSEDKTFTFSLANPSEIVSLVRSEGMPKVAFEQVLAASRAESYPPSKDWIDTELASAKDPETGALWARDARFYLEKIGQHAKKFREEFLVKRAEAQEVIEKTLAKLGQVAKDHILLNNGKISDLFKFACVHDPSFSEGWRVIFQGIREDLMKLGTPLERELIADQLEIPGSETLIINGQNPLLIDLDTLKNKISEDDKSALFIRLLDTFGDAVVDRIRELRTVKDVDQEIMEDIWRLDKSAEAGAESFVEAIAKEGWVGKALLALLGLGAVGTLGKFLRSAAHGATKEVGSRRDERGQLEGLTHGGYRLS